MRSLRATTIVVLAGLLAGCASSVPGPSSASPSPSSAPPLAEQLGLTCGDGHVFHPSLLEAVGGAEADQDEQAAALRAHLASPEGGGVPATGWIRVAQTADRVQFLAPRESGTEWAVVGFFVNQGAWVLDLAGDCHLAVAAPAGAGRAHWWLDPSFPAPAPGDRTIHVVLMEVACSSGTPPEGRVMPPVISVNPTEVLIAIFVRPRPGGQDCPGNPPFPIEVELPEPLGTRALLDAGVFPPRDAAKPPA